MMAKVKVSPWDPAEGIKTGEQAVLWLRIALEEYDPASFDAELNDLARSKGVAGISGVARHETGDGRRCIIVTTTDGASATIDVPPAVDLDSIRRAVTLSSLNRDVGYLTAGIRPAGGEHTMNEDLIQLIKDYATGSHSEIHESLLAKSKDNLIAILVDLLTIYYNDVNSSAMREMTVALLAGYQPNSEKLGYNGFRRDALTGGTEYCEIKPTNIRTDSTRKQPRKLNGGGNFTDYTWARFGQHSDDNPTMLVAGFVDARLVYIFEFNFNEPDFTGRLREQLVNHFPEGDVSGLYLRSASFTFRHYKNASSLQTRRFVTGAELQGLRQHITGEVYAHLRRFAK